MNFLKSVQAVVIAIGAVVVVASSATPCFAQSRSELEQRVRRLEGDVDKALQGYFRYQVEAGWYRSRLKTLQKEWVGLLGNLKTTSMAPAPRRLSSFPPPPRSGFRVDQVIASDGLTIAAARQKAGCKKRRGCRVWARVAFSQSLIKSGAEFEVSVELRRGTTRFAVPARAYKATGPAMIVELPVDRLRLTRGAYTGRIRVMCRNRFGSKTFNMQLSSTF